jgi:undecaprenyl-diphosphatase
VWLLRNGAHKLVAFLVVTCLAGGAIDTVVKIAVARPRPAVENPIITAFGKSFPSGHSMQAVVCFGALLLVFLPLLHERWRTRAIVGTVVLIIAIGFSRLSLGVHYVSDVLGGFALGGAWLAASVAAWETWREDRGRRRARVLAEGPEPEEEAALPVG